MKSTKPETTIESLRSKRRELERDRDRKLREYEADIRVLQRAEELLAQAGSQTSLLQPSKATTDEYADLSVTQAIMAFLDSNPTEEYGISELSEEVERRGVKSESQNFLSLVSATANRLAVKDEKIVRERKKRGKRKKKMVWVYKKK